jgi:hypothetical protein
VTIQLYGFLTMLRRLSIESDYMGNKRKTIFRELRMTKRKVKKIKEKEEQEQNPASTIEGVELEEDQKFQY